MSALSGRDVSVQLLGPASAGRRRRSRRWDRENRPTSYRLDPAVPERVREVQAWYRARGFRVSQGQLVEDLLLYALEAWEEGRVAVNVEEKRPSLRAVARE